MLSTNNIFTPRPVARSPSPPGHGLRCVLPDVAGEEELANPPVFRHVYEIENALADKTIGVRTQIQIRPSEGSSLDTRLEAAGIEVKGASRSLVTTPDGILQRGLPFSFRYVNELIGKNATPIGTIVEEISGSFSRQEVAESLDASSPWASATRRSPD